MASLAKSLRGGFSQTELLLAIVVIGLVVALALPGFVKSKDKAMEAEVKSNLHAIQVALERYATDNGGHYPAFILGGSLGAWACSGDPTCSLGKPVPDALLATGYLDTYPHNPFVREVGNMCAWTKGDPRFGCLSDAPGQGANTTMGNALSDPNFATPDTAANPGTLGPEGFPYYFLGDGDPATRDWLPGAFLYRAPGEKAPTAEFLACFRDNPRESKRCEPSFIPHYPYYVLAVYGSWRTPGKDYLHCYDPHDPAVGFGSVTGGVRCEPEGFDPWVLLTHDPTFGTGDVDGDGDTIPSVLFREPASTAFPGDGIGPTNPDGFADGLLIFFNAGSDQSVGL